MSHALLASAFLAYLGQSRMIHVFAAPLGDTTSAPQRWDWFSAWTDAAT